MEVDKDEMRSSISKYPHLHESQPGVGARQESMPLQIGGGGYLDICTASESPEELRLSELKAIGVGRLWLGVAEMIGTEAFVELWKYLDSSEHGTEHNGQTRVTVPRFSSLLRFQRNQYIKTLDADGVAPREIQERLKAEHGINLNIRTVRRVIG